MTQITIDRALVEQVLETIEGLTRDRLFTAEWAGKHGATIAALRAAMAQQEGGGRLPPPLQAEPVAWRCACGANLYIDADDAPRSKAEPVQEPQTLDAAMQQPRAMAQAYENGYKAGAAAEREAIMDEWSACVQSDLENGVRWLNEQAAKKWQESYPAMAGFADKIYARGETK
jgi:hypothetical protein